MQRQSIGSPGSKIQIKGGVFAGGAAVAVSEVEEEEVKAEKPIRSSLRADRSIHLIPLLTILCFLVLYLLSHDPSPNDLASFGIGARLLDAKAVSVAEIGRHDVSSVVAAVRSNRGLKEEEEGKGKLRHRKLGLL
ncbi:uncharacterized protein [Typha angustifolia]|uniref:uncharacterized protein n=1 Tax=Typha angustifolia TaxID=59011 RepID=UPI003C2E076E